MGSPMVCTGTKLLCTMGMTPAELMVLPLNRVMTNKMPAANIMDNKPMVNILPFGVCKSPMNPATAALTAAALGVLTPGPCIPATTAPWTPGNPMVMVGNMPIVNASSKLICTYGGMISVMAPGQTTVLA